MASIVTSVCYVFVAVFHGNLDIYFGGVSGLYTCGLPCPKQAHYPLRQIFIQHS